MKNNLIQLGNCCEYYLSSEITKEVFSIAIEAVKKGSCSRKLRKDKNIFTGNNSGKHPPPAKKF